MPVFTSPSVALITGASSGLGASTARLFARAGAAVVMTARRQGELDKIAEVIAAEGGTVLAVAADLGDDGSVQALIGKTMERFGQIDFVVNIGGSAEGIGTPLWKITAAQWRNIEAANIAGPMNLVRHVVPKMMARGQGRMLFLSSSATTRPVARTGAYTATKAAVNAMVETLDLEMENTSVAFLAFNPGPIDTPTYKGVVTALEQPAAMRNIAQSPDKAAILPLWLCSAATYGVSGIFVQWRDPDVAQPLDQFAAALPAMLNPLPA
jgi:NADP-dependent 3-hydroxy acid dehydrogenase YdfG